ncbi:MAG: FmdE family protein [Desulfuromonadales bacterium]|nr:FmdE family protein [Desulfuromonadales bacterium]
MADSCALFQRIRERHGHYCAMSTLGGRLGLAALAALGEDGGSLTATYGIDTCAADGIAVATGCLPEQGRLTVHDRGRHRLELRGRGGGVAAELTAAALARAALCRQRLAAGEDAAEVLAGVRNAPDAELLVLTPLPAGESHA